MPKKQCMGRDNDVKCNNTKIIYEIERKNCKRMIQKEKRNFLNNIQQEAEKDCLQGNIRNFFRTIKQYKSYKPFLKDIKNCDGEIILELGLEAIRLKEYFLLKELLNAEYSSKTNNRNQMVDTIFQRAAPILNKVTQDETDKAIASLKNQKAPGSDSVLSELIKCMAKKQLHYAILKICQKIWSGECVPISRNKVIIVQSHKKGDKTVCKNDRDIS